MRAEALGVLDQLLMALQQNGDRVADARGRMVLQHHASARNGTHDALLVRKRGERADGVVIAGDKVLNHQLLVVAGAAQQAKDARELGGLVDLVDLLLSGKIHQVVARGIRRLGDKRIGERLGVDDRIGVAAVKRPGLGVGHAQLFADLVETALLRDVVEHLKAVVRDDIEVGKLAGVLADDAHVPVGTAQKHGHLACGRPFLAQAAQQGRDGRRALVHLGRHAVVGKTARRRHAHVHAGKDDGLDAVGLVEAARIGVREHVAAQHDGNEALRNFGLRDSGKRHLTPPPRSCGCAAWSADPWPSRARGRSPS